MANLEENNQITRLGNVLLVEDNHVFSNFLTATIAEIDSNARILVFSSGTEALQFLENSNTSLEMALIDLGLPDIGGLEVIRACRSHFTEIPILVITVTSSENHLLSAIRAGATGYLLKSDRDFIRDSIMNVLKGNCAISPSLARSLFRFAGGSTSPKKELGLTTRELETLQLLALGDSYKEVAQKMNVSTSTVQSNVRNIYRKLEVNSRMHAVSKAKDSGLL
jgi:DNA-binding NarL/FixJ family response regulator